jgi:hypothetical protein
VEGGGGVGLIAWVMAPWPGLLVAKGRNNINCLVFVLILWRQSPHDQIGGKASQLTDKVGMHIFHRITRHRILQNEALGPSVDLSVRYRDQNIIQEIFILYARPRVSKHERTAAQNSVTQRANCRPGECLEFWYVNALWQLLQAILLKNLYSTSPARKGDAALIVALLYAKEFALHIRNTRHCLHQRLVVVAVLSAQ